MRSFAPADILNETGVDGFDELDGNFGFFGLDQPSSRVTDDDSFFNFSETPSVAQAILHQRQQPWFPTIPPTPEVELETDEVDQDIVLDMSSSMRMDHAKMLPTGVGWIRKAPDQRFGVREAQTQPQPRKIRRNKISDSILKAALDNSNRREYGMGLVGQLLDREFRVQRMDSNVQKQMRDIHEHRPYFSYWISVVHILTMIISLAVYGLAPLGFSTTETTGLILMANLAKESVSYQEAENFWIGPRPADLISLGAKYTPCMHKDDDIYKSIEESGAVEVESGCCLKNDGSGCVQTTRDQCQNTFTTFLKWSDIAEGGRPESRVSGPVCGQDPRLCKAPSSVIPHEWEDDITEWPVCLDSVDSDELSPEEYPHMTCENTGHPCCIGIHGQCQIVTREYCKFVHGHFHEEANLCSQVLCMDDICGLIPFTRPGNPDQIYRLWTSLFLHAGLLHCLITVLFQMTIMRDIEKMCGWLRISIIYLLSGIGGNLASCILMPYHAEVGPAGCQFGLLACLFVEVIQSWQILKSPWRAIGKLFVIFLILLCFGMLPWVDNFAHIAGFLSGSCLAFAFLPYISFGEWDRNRKRFQIMVALLIYTGLMAAGITLLFVYPPSECKSCQILNCIPFTDNFCKFLDVQLSFANEDGQLSDQKVYR